jgi:Flp pilus assembly pilin Flp
VDQGRIGLPRDGSRASWREGEETEGSARSMRLNRIIRQSGGQDLMEYALLITLISLALIAALTLIGTSITAMFNTVAAVF